MDHCKQEAELKHMGSDIDEIKACLKEIKGDIISIKISLASPSARPSWGVATALMVLSSICVSFIVFYLTVGSGGQ